MKLLFNFLNRKYIVFFRYVFLEDNKGEDGMKFTGCDLPQTIQDAYSSAAGNVCVRLHLQYQNKAAAFFVFGVYGQCAVHLRSNQGADG